MIPSLEELYLQYRIDEKSSADDALLTLYAKAAREKTENYLNRPVFDEEVPEMNPDGIVMNTLIKLAVMQLVCFWYDNREQGDSLPKGFHQLLKAYRIRPGT